MAEDASVQHVMAILSQNKEMKEQIADLQNRLAESTIFCEDRLQKHREYERKMDRLVRTLTQEKAELVSENTELMADIQEWQDAHARTQEQLNDLRRDAETDREALLDANREVVRLQQERDEARMWFQRSRAEIERLDAKLKLSICRESGWIKARKAELEVTPEAVLTKRLAYMHEQNSLLAQAVMAGSDRCKDLRAAMGKAYEELAETRAAFGKYTRDMASREVVFNAMLARVQADMAAFKDGAPGNKRARKGSLDSEDGDAVFEEFLAAMEEGAGAGAGHGAGAAASSART